MVRAGANAPLFPSGAQVADWSNTGQTHKRVIRGLDSYSAVHAPKTVRTNRDDQAARNRSSSIESGGDPNVQVVRRRATSEPSTATAVASGSATNEAITLIRLAGAP